jgi:hypothetical protein
VPSRWSRSAGESEQLERVVAGRAGFGLEDAAAKSVLEVQHLVAEGEVTDLRVLPEKLTRLAAGRFD